MNAIINDISTFSLSIFSIGMTVFTVIYSFISNKKEYLNEVSSTIIFGKASPETIAKYRIAEGYIQRQIKYNRIILFISIMSLVVYILSLLYIRVYHDSHILEYIIIVLFAILSIVFFFSLSKLITTYLRYIR